jgi:cell division protein FtsZ
VEAARQAISSPLLEVNINGAQGILFNVTGSSTLSLYEVTEAAEEIRAAADPEANIIFGTSFNERLGDEVMITVIATGFDGRRTTSRAAAGAGASSSADGTARVPRDFLEELERQRTQLNDAGVPDAPDTRPDEAAAKTGGRSVGEPVPVKRAAFDTDDLEIPSFLRRPK